MSDNWNAHGPIVVWHNYGCEGWSPRSYSNVTEAIKAGIESGDVISWIISIRDVVKAPDLSMIPYSPTSPQLPQSTD